MAKEREPIMTVACGRRATGKSIETIKTLYKYVNGNAAMGIKPRKVLIFDANNEYGTFDFIGQTHHIKSLNVNHIKQFSHPTYQVQIRRIAPFHPDGTRMNTSQMQDTLEYILKEFKGGCLLIEDINKYVSDSAPADIIGSIATLRQSANDVIIHYQNIGRVGNPKILGNTNIIRMHKTNDQVMRHASKFEDKIDILSVAQSIVNKRYDYGKRNNIKDETGEFFFLYVDLEFGIIRGDFNQSEAEDAITEYVSTYHQKLVKPLMNRIDKNTGKKLFTAQTAYAQIERNFLNDFFDFK